MNNRMWGGRYESGPAEIMEEINASIDFDKRLASQDIRGSLAHAAMLVGGREDLERSRHVEELHRREGQYLHDPRGTWRKTRALCHSRQSVTR